MMNCPQCQHAAHARSSRYLSNDTKERYHQCTNINCGCTFKSLESISGIIAKPQLVNLATPHPGKDNQGTLWF